MARTPADDSADALRRRADALLDEMMLGGVDIGAGFGADAISDPGYTNGFTENGAHHHEVKPEQRYAAASSELASSSVIDDEGGVVRPSQGATARPLFDSGQRDDARRPFPEYPPQDEPSTTLGAAAAGDVPKGDARLIPAEDRYARPAPPIVEPPMPLNGPTRSPNSAVRRQSASLASSMTVGARASARSTLLPREVEIDADTAAQEIHALNAEIAASLPIGHEAAERGRHLLSKAQHILDSDPSRSAEVEYYIQQVRRIVQRTRQMHNDSSLYRNRLILYLMAWAALALTGVAARYLLQGELVALLEAFFWVGSDSIWVQFGPMVIGAFFAGALGAAISVLLNMRRHGAREHGYFDRKYGLRGLLLPILGAVFGVLIALVWAAVCYFTRMDGLDIWVGSLPALFAFLVGFSQEWLYGAR